VKVLLAEERNVNHEKHHWEINMERVGGAAFRPAGKRTPTEEDKKEAEEMVKRMKAIALRQMKTGKIL